MREITTMMQSIVIDTLYTKINDMIYNQYCDGLFDTANDIMLGTGTSNFGGFPGRRMHYETMSI
jgi:hypothetical protein